MTSNSDLLRELAIEHALSAGERVACRRGAEALVRLELVLVMLNAQVPRDDEFWTGVEWAIRGATPSVAPRPTATEEP